MNNRVTWMLRAVVLLGGAFALGSAVAESGTILTPLHLQPGQAIESSLDATDEANEHAQATEHFLVDARHSGPLSLGIDSGAIALQVVVRAGEDYSGERVGEPSEVQPGQSTTIALPAGGQYFVEVRSTDPGGTGSYTVSLPRDGSVAMTTTHAPWKPAVRSPQPRRVADWGRLAWLAGHEWKHYVYRDGVIGRFASSRCEWAPLGVAIECFKSYNNSGKQRFAYVMDEDGRVFVTGLSRDGRVPVTLAADGTVSFSYTTPHHLPASQTIRFRDEAVEVTLQRIGNKDATHMSVRGDAPGDAPQVAWIFANEWQQERERREREAMLAAEAARARAQALAEQRAWEAEQAAYDDYEDGAGEGYAETSPAADIMGGFMRGLSEGMASNAELESILRRGNDQHVDAYDNGGDQGYEDERGYEEPGYADGGEGTSRVTVVLFKGFQVPITPGATSNEGCFARVQVGPVTSGWGRPGEARQAAASAEERFLAACRQLGPLTGGSSADEFYIDSQAESAYASMRANRWQHEVGIR